MTEEQQDMLHEWGMNLIVEHRLDYFRGSVIRSLTSAFLLLNGWSLKAALLHCNDAEERNVRICTNDYDELSKELEKISKEVPLNDNFISAITNIFRGEWKDAISYIKEIDIEFNKRK
jgi:hypothetical protein